MSDYLSNLIQLLNLRRQMNTDRVSSRQTALGGLSQTAQHWGDIWAKRKEAEKERGFTAGESALDRALSEGLENTRQQGEDVRQGKQLDATSIQNMLDRMNQRDIQGMGIGSQEKMAGEDRQAAWDSLQAELNADPNRFSDTPGAKMQFERDLALASAGKATLNIGEKADIEQTVRNNVHQALVDYLEQKQKGVEGSITPQIDWARWTQEDTNAVMKIIGDMVDAAVSAGQINRGSGDQIKMTYQVLTSLPTQSQENPPGQPTVPPGGEVDTGEVFDTGAGEANYGAPEPIAPGAELLGVVNEKERPWYDAIKKIADYVRLGKTAKEQDDAKFLEEVMRDITTNAQTSWTIEGTHGRTAMLARLKKILSAYTGRETP